MNSKIKTIIPKGFFSKPQNIITTEEALKDVIPVNWVEVKKKRKSNKNQAVTCVNTKVN